MIGWSGSGKTTLITGLMPVFIKRGYSVSSMKHTHHEFDMDKPGKDSYEHRMAGAKQVLITGAKRWALLTENFNSPEPQIDDLLSKMDQVDLVLIEGFKAFSHPKMEIYRSAIGKPLLAKENPTIAAIATDDPSVSSHLPIIDLNDLNAIADFIVNYCNLHRRENNGSVKR